MASVTKRNCRAPVSLDEVKRYLRIDDTCEDQVLELDLIPAAVDWLERETRRHLRYCEVTESFDCLPNSFRLSVEPVCKLTKVELCDVDGWHNAVLRDWTLVHEGGRACFRKPRCQCVCLCTECSKCCCKEPSRVRFTYMAGYDHKNIPPFYKQAIKWAVSHFWTYREPVTDGKAIEVPMSLQRAITRMRKHTIHEGVTCGA